MSLGLTGQVNIAPLYATESGDDIRFGGAAHRRRRGLSVKDSVLVYATGLENEI